MKDARFSIPTPALLAKVVDLIDTVPMDDRDTKGDVYEYMLGKIASAGQNGQFRTPRHIIQLMVRTDAPDAEGHRLRPGLRHLRLSGRGGRVSAASSIPDSSRDAKLQQSLPPRAVPRLRLRRHHAAHRQHEHGAARHREPDICCRDSLAEDHAGEEEKYTLVLANPPFAGSLDYETTAKDLQQIVKTKKTELLFLALFLRLLKPGGRAAVIVPDGVLFGSSNAHKELRSHAGGGAEARCGDLAARPACSSPMPASRPRSCCSPRLTRAARTTSGSTMCRRMAGRWTTSARRCWPRRSWASRPATP